MLNSKRKCVKGLSLIEVMISMVIMSLIGLGTASLLQNMFNVQRKANLKASALQIQETMTAVLRNDTAWQATVDAPANSGVLSCLREPPVPAAGCNDGQTSANNFVIHNRDGAAWYNLVLPGTGFDANGNVCATFNPTLGSGSDACPFRFEVRWTATCPNGVGPCVKPQVSLAVTLNFNPADPSDPRNRIDVNEFTTVIERGEKVLYEPFEIQHSLSAPPNHEGGPCTAGAWVTRPLSNEAYDPAGNVTLAANQITVQPGNYECKIVAQSYEPHAGFSIRLRDITNGLNYSAGGGYSGWRNAIYSSGSVTFTLSNVATFQLQHNCGDISLIPSSTDPGAWPGLDVFAQPEFDMGIPAPDYTNETVVTSISCVRSS